MCLVYAKGMLKSIAIDATHYGSAQPTGVEIYTDSLLPLLSKYLVQKGCAVTWISHTKDKMPGVPQEVVWVHSRHRPLWGQRALSSLLKVLEPELFFTPSGIPPLTYKGRVSLMVHDMSVYLHPESYDWQERFRLRTVSSRVVPRANPIIVPSNYTKQWVQKIWKIAPEKIKVIPHGYSPSNIPAEPLTDLLVSDSPIFACVGRIETKKNLFPVIMAFARLHEEQEARLVLAGGPGHGYSNLIKAIRALSPAVQKDIFLPGYISEGQKNWLESKATVYLIPSLLEGFGLPLLEAFEAGVPVICSQSGALPEVAGQAALYVQGDIATDWYLHMRDCLADPATLKEKVEAGRSRLKDFSWEKTAEQTAEVFLNSGE